MKTDKTSEPNKTASCSVWTQHFGCCPICHKEPIVLNLGSDHWAMCVRHRVIWCLGSNLFSSWHKENQTIWDKNKKRLERCAEVRPYLPPPDPKEVLKRSIDSLLFQVDVITPSIEKIKESLKYLCEQNGIDYQASLKRATEFYDDTPF